MPFLEAVTLAKQSVSGNLGDVLRGQGNAVELYVVDQAVVEPGLAEQRADHEPMARPQRPGRTRDTAVRADDDSFLPHEMHNTQLVHRDRRIKPGRYSRARFTHNQIFAERLALVHAL